MAYARRSTRRRSTARSSYRPTRRRVSTRRTVSRRRSPARNRRRASSGGGTVRLEIIQRPFEANPIAAALAETKKEIPPKKARI